MSGHPCQFLAVGLLLSYQLHMSGGLTKCCRVAVGFGTQKSAFFHLCRKRLRLPVPVQHPQSIASEQSAEWELCPRGEFLPVGLGSGTHSSVSGVLLYELYSVLFRSNVVGKSMKGKRKDIWMRTRLVPPRLRK